MADTLLWIGLANLVEDAICITRLILNGVFDRYPGLRIVSGQLGGMFPFMLGRFDLLYGMYATVAEKSGIVVTDRASTERYLRRLGDYTDNVYVDTHSMDAPAIKCAVEVLGHDKVLYGSDYPITPASVGRVADIAKIKLSSMDFYAKQAVLGGNAASILKI